MYETDIFDLLFCMLIKNKDVFSEYFKKSKNEKFRNIKVCTCQKGNSEFLNSYQTYTTYFSHL